MIENEEKQSAVVKSLKEKKKQVFKKMIDSQKIGNFFFLIFSLKKIFR